MKFSKIGLALGSGAGRGWAHIGVLRVLEREGLLPDIVAGTSIGALVGGVWCADQLDRLESWARGLNRLRILRYLDFGFNGGGLISGQRLRRALVDGLGDCEITDCKRQFVAVTTELHTGHEIWMRQGPLAQALCASYALPGIFSPVTIDGRDLVDGALVNPIPVSVCRAYGARIVIAVNLNNNAPPSDLELIPAPSTTMPPESEPDMLDAVKAASSASSVPLRLLSRLLPGSEKDDDNSLFNILVTSLNILQDRVCRSRLAGDPPDIVIQPQVDDIGLLEFDKADTAIERGIAATERALPEIRHAIQLLSR